MDMIVNAYAVTIGPIKTALCHAIFTIEFAFKSLSFSIWVGRYALNAGTNGIEKLL